MEDTGYGENSTRAQPYERPLAQHATQFELLSEEQPWGVGRKISSVYFLNREILLHVAIVWLEVHRIEYTLQ